MNEQANEAAAPEAVAPEAATITPLTTLTGDKFKAIAKVLSQRIICDNINDAVKALQAATKKLNPEAEADSIDIGVPVNFQYADTADFGDSVVAVSQVRNRVRTEAGGKMQHGIQAIAVFAMPTLDDFIESDSGRAWLDKIIEKEAGHVAHRPLRELTTLEAMVRGMAEIPVGAEAFATVSRREAGMDMEGFDLVWVDIRALVKESNAAIAENLPNKGECVKCLRSTAYAVEHFEQLEKLGVFVWLGAAIVDGIEVVGADADPVIGWLADRDTEVLVTKVKEVTALPDDLVLGTLAVDSNNDGNIDGSKAEAAAAEAEAETTETTTE